MGTEHVLAIDLGTGGPKAALVTPEGRITAHEFEPTPLELLADGGVEQDPDAWWAAITTAVRRVMEGGHVSADDVVAVAITSQGPEPSPWIQPANTSTLRSSGWIHAEHQMSTIS